MNARKAKRLRKAVYGDQSTRPANRHYSADKASGTLHAPGHRALYQGMKRAARAVGWDRVFGSLEGRR